MLDLAVLTKAVETGDRATAVAVTRAAIEAGLPPDVILAAMIEAMATVGGKFQLKQLYLPEMLIAARAMKEATAVLEPVLVGAGFKPEHTAVIGTIKGDLHDIGKNLVGMMWKGANFEVIDLGTNVSGEQFVEAVRAHGAELVGISALLTTTMPAMGQAVATIRAAGLTDVRILVGGAPVTPEFAAQIGADAYAADAGAAVDVARRVLAG
jgi:5-methyltetrahydrofolate--homocysteine methyltransferase